MRGQWNSATFFRNQHAMERNIVMGSRRVACMEVIIDAAI